MGCSDSRDFYDEQGEGRRDSLTSWAGTGSRDWQTLFGGLSEDYNFGCSGRLRGPVKKDVKFRNADKGAIYTRDSGDCSLGIKGNRTTEDFLRFLQPGEHFIDDEFGPGKGSIYYDTPDEYLWKRPLNLSNEAQMMVRGTDARDVRCGFHTNTWFLQPLSVISGYAKVVNKIIADPVALNDHSLSGMLKFRFWRFGEWTTVYVDDRLPVNEYDELMYAHSEDGDEFWVPLVEKAYAKLHGCYEAIECGDPVDALTDLTGGLVERYPINGPDPIVYHKMARALGAGSLVSCTRKSDWSTNMDTLKQDHLHKRALEAEKEAHLEKKRMMEMEKQYEIENRSVNFNDMDVDDLECGNRFDDAEESVAAVHSRPGSAKSRLDDGITEAGDMVNDDELEKEAIVDEFDPQSLLAENLYRVTMTKRVARAKGTELLLKLKNTWTQGEEWKGAWCDGDYRWELLTSSTKKDMNYVDRDDGEFWMSYGDFCKHFKDVMICTIPRIVDENSEDEGFEGILALESAWREGVNAGGSRDGPGCHFERNPQFELKVFERDLYDTTVLAELRDPQPRTCSVVVNLLQDYRKTDKRKEIQMMHIGFSIYRLDEGEYRITSHAIATRSEIGSSGPHINSRNVTARFELPPGRYTIIPTTFGPEQGGDFLLRVASAKTVELTEAPPYSVVQDRKQEEETAEESGHGSGEEDNPTPDVDQYPEIDDYDT